MLILVKNLKIKIYFSSIQSELCTMEPIIVPENSTLNPMAAEFVPSMQLITAAS